MKTPTPEQVKFARKAAGLTQAQAAALVHCHWRTWQDWETGRRAMHPAFWELFLLKAGQGEQPRQDLQATPQEF